MYIAIRNYKDFTKIIKHKIEFIDCALLAQNDLINKVYEVFTSTCWENVSKSE